MLQFHINWQVCICATLSFLYKSYIKAEILKREETKELQVICSEQYNSFYFSELKAEVEKLRSAQASSLGVEPERVRLFQQEITALRSKLCQQEREMLEANRSALLIQL